MTYSRKPFALSALTSRARARPVCSRIAFDPLQLLLDRFDRRPIPIRRGPVATEVCRRFGSEEILLIPNNTPLALLFGIGGSPYVVVRLRPRGFIGTTNERHQLGELLRRGRGGR